MKIEHKNPVVSLNKLGEYLTAKPARRAKIVVDQKRPKEFIVTRYKEATTAIVHFLEDGGDNIDILDAAISKLESKRARTPFQEQDRVLSIEAIHAFQELYSTHAFEGIGCRRAPTGSPKLEFGGVAISVAPNLIVRGSNRRGETLLGEVKLHFSKTHPLVTEAGEYIGTTLFEHATRTLSDQGKVDVRCCLSVDVFAKQIYMAPRAFKKRKQDIEAACAEIALHWDAA